MNPLSNWLAKLTADRFIPMRTKFMVSMVAMILLFGAINMALSYNFVVGAVREQMRKKEELILGMLEQQVGGMILGRDFASLRRLLAVVQGQDDDILYIVAYDPDGRIIGHTFEDNRVPRFLHAPPGKDAENLRDARRRIHVRQKAMSIWGGGLGTIVLGMHEGAILLKSRRVNYAMSGMVALFLVLGLGGALVFSHFISAPIRQILEGYAAFVPGGRMPRIRTRLNDEMRLLAEGFTRMMERINDADREFKATQTKIIETEKLAGMGTLAASLAHEINNPIAGIQACVRRLQKARPQDAKQAEYLQLIHEATEHVRTVVQDLLGYAHQADGRKETVDLRVVVAEAVRLLQPRLKKCDIHLHLKTPDLACAFHCLRANLVQVVVNGIINALEAVGDEGNIWIDLARGEGRYILTIRDDGSGLTSEVASRAFDPFYTTKGANGTGLGLYVCRNIVTANGGAISLQGSPGGGAALEVTLPNGGKP